jgi:hypothetical protein
LPSCRSLFLLVALAAACKRTGVPADAPTPDAGSRREIVRIQQVTVEAQAWPPEAGAPLDDRVLASRIWEVLSQSDDFQAVGRRVPPDASAGAVIRRARLKTVYGVELVPEPSTPPRLMRAAVTIAVEWADEGDGQELWESLACDGELPKDKAQYADLAPRLVDCALEKGARGLIEKEGLRHADPATVVAALGSSDPALRQVAFGVIAERRLTAAVPRLLELLHSPDVLVRDGAIGALVALREPRAVKPLTELAQFNDLDMMRRIIDAVGAIGGDEARSYLELVASGHSVPLIRELAEKALDRLTRKSRDGGAP